MCRWRGVPPGPVSEAAQCGVDSFAERVCAAPEAFSSFKHDMHDTTRAWSPRPVESACLKPRGRVRAGRGVFAAGLAAACLDLAMAQAPASGPAAVPPALQAPAAAAEDPSFDIYWFEVEGNTRLPEATVEKILLPFMGPGRRLADAEAARKALEQAYQQGGYLTVLVDLPEQRVDEGVLRLVVLEGRVERLRVTGARYFSQGAIRQAVPALAEGGVPDFNAVQQQLALLNRNPARQVQPVLRAGSEPGTVEAELKVSDRPPGGFSVELNNRHAADTDPLRLVASARWDNLFQREHSVALTVITAPARPEQSRVLVGNYSAPLPQAEADRQASWVGSVVLSDSTLEPLGAATVLGRGLTLGLRHVHSLQVGSASHSFALGAEYRDLRERIVAGSDALSTPLRYLPLQASYSLGLFEGRSVTQLNALLSFGIGALNRRRIDCPGNIGPVDQFACRRLGADGDFAVLRVDLRHERPLLGGQLLLRAGGQWAQQPLMGGEQLSLGGAGSVRGYYEGEASGDAGLMAAAEWRSASLAPQSLRAWLADARALVFVEAAQARTLQPLPGQAARVPLVGTGLGLRLAGPVAGVGSTSSWSAELELAWPHKPARLNPDRDPRWHGRVGLAF